MNGKGFFPKHDWLVDLIDRAGVPLWAKMSVLSPLIVASSILTELVNVAAERFPAWLAAGRRRRPPRSRSAASCAVESLDEPGRACMTLSRGSW